MEGTLRGIDRHEGARPLETIQEGFEQLAHGRQGIGIKQCAHPLPQQALAPELQPDRSEQGTTQLLRLVHQKCRKHHRGQIPQRDVARHGHSCVRNYTPGFSGY